MQEKAISFFQQKIRDALYEKTRVCSKEHTLELLYKEYPQHGWWFQKALAMPSPTAAESLPLTREVAKIFDF